MSGSTGGIGIHTTVDLPFAEAVQATRSALAAHGFGVITEIDLQAAFREKIQEQSPPYTILGACNPRAALEATRLNPEVGLLLPCNVAIYEREGRVHVAAVDPQALFAMLDDHGQAGLADLAAEVRRALEATIASLPGARAAAR